MYFEELKNKFGVVNYLSPHSGYSIKDFLHYDRLQLESSKPEDIYFFFVRRMGTSLVEIKGFITENKINGYFQSQCELNYNSFNFILHKGFILVVFSKEFLKGFLELYLVKTPTNHYCNECNYNFFEWEVKFIQEFFICLKCNKKTNPITRYNYLINT